MLARTTPDEGLIHVLAETGETSLKQGVTDSPQKVPAPLAEVEDGDTGSARKKLAAAIDEFEAQAGKHITLGQRGALTADLRRVKAISRVRKAPFWEL